jgi:1-deoxy-D-xylulose-5-phosphate reductoisomerase
MRLPIQYALTYPERLSLDLPAVDFAALGALHFGPMDMERYPCFAVAVAAGTKGGTYPAAVAAADEEAVAAFLDSRLRFTDIPNLLAETLDKHAPEADPDLDAVMAADGWGREFARAWIEDHPWSS